MTVTTHSSSPAVSPRTVRKDALRNRMLLLESADAMMREHGIELSLNAVACHAGVGVGTAYRHFHDRDALIDAMFELRVEQIARTLVEHLGDDDPVVGLRDAALEICEMQATDRGLWEVVSAGSRDNHREMVQTRLLPLIDRLVAGANASGRLRTPFETTDLPVLLWAGGASNAYLGHISPTAWRRHVELVLNGYLRDDDPARTTVKHHSPTREEFDTAMSTFHSERRPRARSGSRP